MNTKRLALILAAGLLVGSLCAFAYRLGHSRTKHMVETFNLAAFITELSALEDLRSNNAEVAIERLENHVYVTALMAMESESELNRKTFEMFRPGLIDYRREYAASPAHWSPVESNLEARLSASADKQ